jgi:peptide/nickel transport system ATP-binding protein
VANDGGAPHPPLLSVRDLRVEFLGKSGPVRAVDGVSFDIAPGETLGIVGESGSGKTTVGRAVLRLIPAAGGTVEFEGEDVIRAPASRLRVLRRRMQIVFQDPGGSLNPRMRVGDAICEPLLVHGAVRSKSDALARAGELLERCGLSRDAATRYPHQFSGGQRQRVCIARALALSPSLIVCDEPTSALDVSVQAQVLNLLMDLQRDLRLSYLFISHDIGVVQHVASRIAVMKAGRIVEMGDARRVLEEPGHEYTRTLLGAVLSRTG